MGKIVNHSESAARKQLLQAALKSFAEYGYAATSVRRIVDAAHLSKPSLYYYFDDKAGIFQALVNHAHDERYRLMREAADHAESVAEKLEEIVASIFEFSAANQPLMRLAFATAFAPAGEAPGRSACTEKGRRNYDFVRTVMEQGMASGELDQQFSSDEMTMGFYGQLNSYVMVRLFFPDVPMDRPAARRLVQLFLKGAAKKKK